MKRWYYLLSFLTCLSCSKPFTITAKVNNSRWYGAGYASKVTSERVATCVVKRFGISAITDISWETPILAKPSGCVGNCTPAQLIDFFNIPLARGRYDLTLPDSCLPSSLGKVRLGYLKINPNGPHILKGTSVDIVDEFELGTTNSWIQVTKYNSESGLIKGKFAVELINKQGRILKLRKGKFSSKIYN